MNNKPVAYCNLQFPFYTNYSLLIYKEHSLDRLVRILINLFVSKLTMVLAILQVITALIIESILLCTRIFIFTVHEVLSHPAFKLIALILCFLCLVVIYNGCNFANTQFQLDQGCQGYHKYSCRLEIIHKYSCRLEIIHKY